MTEHRRILLDGAATEVVRQGDDLVAPDGRTVSAEEAVHLPPVQPSKIIAVHLNYRSRVEEFMTKLPPAPTYFQKPTTALNAHEGKVVRPAGCKYLNFEGEVAIVIGQTCRGVAPSEAEAYIAGYTIANDYGLHDFRDTDAGSMLRVKGSDTLCPVGPGLVIGWDFRDKVIRTIVNGETRQDADLSELIWSVPEIISIVSQSIALKPGDLIMTGTPAGVGALDVGDSCTISIAGLGQISSTIGPKG